LSDEVLHRVLDKAFAPPPPPVSVNDLISGLRTLDELRRPVLGTEGNKDPPTTGEAVLQFADRALDAVKTWPETAAKIEALKRGESVGGLLSLLSPKALVENLGRLSAKELGDWLATAIADEVVTAEILAPINLEPVAQALSLGEAAKARLAEAIKIADAMLEDVPSPA